MEEGKSNINDFQRGKNSNKSQVENSKNRNVLFKNTEEILLPENLEESNVTSIMYENFSFVIKDFINLQSVKNLSIDDKEIINELKHVNFLEISNDQQNLIYNYDDNLQIFIFSNIPRNILELENESIVNKLSLNEFSKRSNNEILRFKKIKISNKVVLVVKSKEIVEENHTLFLKLDELKENKIQVEYQNKKSLQEKLTRCNPINSYNNETKLLKAENRSTNGFNKQNLNSSRHNSGTDNLSWRKFGSENNKEAFTRNYYVGNEKKNNHKQQITNFNYNNSYTKLHEQENKRERFNSEAVTNFNYNRSGKYTNNNNNFQRNSQKNFHKNSFSNVNNIYFSKNQSNVSCAPTLTSLNTTLNSANKNYSNEIEIDTSKIKYPLQIKFKYSENDIDNLYQTLKMSGDLSTPPNFNHIKQEIISDICKDLNKNFFSKIDFNKNSRDRANTFQTYLSNTEVKGLEKSFRNFNISEEGLKKSENDNQLNDNPEKKKIDLNLNSPKFTRKTNGMNDIPTFNPLSNISMPFNKFDEYDPSAN